MATANNGNNMSVLSIEDKLKKLQVIPSCKSQFEMKNCETLDSVKKYQSEYLLSIGSTFDNFFAYIIGIYERYNTMNEDDLYRNQKFIKLTPIEVLARIATVNSKYKYQPHIEVLIDGIYTISDPYNEYRSVHECPFCSEMIPTALRTIENYSNSKKEDISLMEEHFLLSHMYIPSSIFISILAVLDIKKIIAYKSPSYSHKNNIISMQKIILKKIEFFNLLPEQVMAGIVESLAFHPIEELYLRSSEFSENGIIDWTSHLKVSLEKCSTLRILDLSQSLLHNEDTVVIANALSKCNALSELHLHNNYIGNVGAVAIARTLSIWPLLSILNLDCNRCDDSGAIAFATALPTCTSLKIFKFTHDYRTSSASYKGVSDIGAIAFADILPKCRVLEEFSIGNNSLITTTGAIAFATAIQLCTLLKVFTINNINFGDSGMQAFNTMISKCPKLKIFYL